MGSYGLRVQPGLPLSLRGPLTPPPLRSHFSSSLSVPPTRCQVAFCSPAAVLITCFSTAGSLRPSSQGRKGFLFLGGWEGNRSRLFLLSYPKRSVLVLVSFCLKNEFIYFFMQDPLLPSSVLFFFFVSGLFFCEARLCSAAALASALTLSGSKLVMVAGADSAIQFIHLSEVFPQDFSSACYSSA